LIDIHSLIDMDDVGRAVVSRGGGGVWPSRRCRPGYFLTRTKLGGKETYGRPGGKETYKPAGRKETYTDSDR
jgi:hypothetical protein